MNNNDYAGFDYRHDRNARNGLLPSQREYLTGLDHYLHYCTYCGKTIKEKSPKQAKDAAELDHYFHLKCYTTHIWMFVDKEYHHKKGGEKK